MKKLIRDLMPGDYVYLRPVHKRYTYQKKNTIPVLIVGGCSTISTRDTRWEFINGYNTKENMLMATECIAIERTNELLSNKVLEFGLRTPGLPLL